MKGSATLKALDCGPIEIRTYEAAIKKIKEVASEIGLTGAEYCERHPGVPLFLRSAHMNWIPMNEIMEDLR